MADKHLRQDDQICAFRRRSPHGIRRRFEVVLHPVSHTLLTQCNLKCSHALFLLCFFLYLTPRRVFQTGSGLRG